MTKELTKRKLTAILSADVKGYSRLMGDDEEATVRTITEYREVMTGLIEEQNGGVVDAKGDNLLAEFPSVVDAVRCGVMIQKELKVKNDELPENRKMEFRVGINLGDVIEEEKTIYGDGVNIAARLEGLAEGGGICISRMAFDNVKNKLDVGYEYLGEHSVKNIAEPVRVYKVLMESEYAGKVIGEKKPKLKQWRFAVLVSAVILIAVVGAFAVWHFYYRPPPFEPASVEKMAFPLPEKPSIAVLPFENMSDDPGKEYLSDGITEQIITILSKLPRLFVISRTSTFSYKGKPVKVQQVAEELGVRYVLEGSVQQSGDKIRITAQLIDALTGRHLWADRYERDYKDIFAIQDEISLEVLKEIGGKLTEGEKVHTRAKKLPNFDAFEKYLEAVPYLRAFNIESNATARRLAEEVIVLDPDFSRGYSLLAAVIFMDVHLGSSKSPRKSFAQATELLKKAIDLDENGYTAYYLLGHVYGMQRQFDKAIAAGKKAIELAPNSDSAYVWLAMTLTWMGKPEEAIELYKKAMRLCPFPPSYYYLQLGNAYRTTGQYEKATTEYKKALHLTPKNIFAFLGLAVCYGLSGLEQESKESVEEVLKINPNYNIKYYRKRMYRFSNQDLVKRWADALRKAGLPEGA